MIAPMTVNGISSAATDKEKNKTNTNEEKSSRLKKIQRLFYAYKNTVVSPTIYGKYNFSI